MNKFSRGIIVLFILGLVFFGGALTYRHFGKHIDRIAPTYALDCIVDTSKIGATSVCYPSGQFPMFWLDATKNTTFTVDGKPVEITDIQVFYKETKTNDCPESIIVGNKTYTVWVSGFCSPIYCYIYGNITYYPHGIENSQTYVAPTSTPAPSCPCTENKQ
jgi:hypothetical protein